MEYLAKVTLPNYEPQRMQIIMVSSRIAEKEQIAKLAGNGVRFVRLLDIESFLKTIDEDNEEEGNLCYGVLVSDMASFDKNVITNFEHVIGKWVVVCPKGFEDELSSSYEGESYEDMIVLIDDLF